jgi:hypothetical protein
MLQSFNNPSPCLVNVTGAAAAGLGTTWEQSRMIIATMKSNLDFIQ